MFCQKIGGSAYQCSNNKQETGSVMQIEKTLINNCLRVSKISWKFHIPTIYDLAVITREICYFLKK